MKNIRLVFIGATLFILFACDMPSQPFFQPPTATAPSGGISVDCGGTQPVQQDVAEAFQHSQPFFSSGSWESSYAVMEEQVRVTWTNDDLGAVANFDYVIFCNATDSSLDEYFTPATLDIIMENYDEHELYKECSAEGQRLYDFKAKEHGLAYGVRFWVQILDRDHIVESLLAFPSDAQNNLDLYSRRIMPELSSCE